LRLLPKAILKKPLSMHLMDQLDSTVI